MPKRTTHKFFGNCAIFLSIFLSGSVLAFDAPDRSGVGQAEFRATELKIENAYRLTEELTGPDASKAMADLAALGIPATFSRVDVRGGRWSTLLPAEPLVPGQGVGNRLTWAGLGMAAPGDDRELAAAALQAVNDYLQANSHLLRIDTSELAESGRTTVYRDGAVIQIFFQRYFEGLPVRGSHLAATINHGNLVLMGTENWGDIVVSTVPRLSASAAADVVRSHVAPFEASGEWGKTELIVLPAAKGQDLGKVTFGDGFEYRLAWVIRPSFDGELRRFEALVDAHSGQMLSFQDTNHYADVRGGVYPVTNDGIVPDGVEQPGWPMPFQDVSTSGGTLTTDTGGNLAAVGSMTATFFGPYVDINDNCGAASLTQNGGIDWGSSSGTDCVTPGFGGAGNTHSSRTGFYEINKIVEMGRGQLPGNTWLQQRLTANMNINQTCNAFWGGGTINFYRSGGGCANTGEIAAVFDHEWGHGLDDNDAFPTIASPSGEGIADIYSALRLNDSCIGRNFLASNCSGFGDPCLNCTGVRDIDYLMRASGLPHTYTWSNANCGGSVHCVGAVYAEAVWSLWKRELQGAPYNYDNNTAHEIVTRLTYIGGGNTGTWFSGGPPNGGCAASSGYMNYLAADDDNGNLSDGTPHMTAIFNAFNDQEIACATPAVLDAGCAGTPTVAPSVTTGNGNSLVTLSWGAVPGATEYEVFRTEGVFACDFGKVRLGSTTTTSWNDNGLQNGRDYSYVVIPKGPADSCFGPASSCATDAPVGAPDFNVSCAPSMASIAQGESDTATCTVISSFGYTGTVNLSCSGNPAGIGCSFAPTSVTPPPDGSDASTLTLDVDGAQATGTFVFDVEAEDGAATRTSTVTVQVVPAGSDGPQDAVYDAGLGAPKCAIAGSPCDSNTLLDSRDSLSPGEPNQPNTLDVCADGTSGSYHSDESNDRIVVSTLDGGNFTEGDTVEIAATVYAWSSGTSDTLDLYYAADANSPAWNFIGSIVPPGGGTQVLTAQYVLPAGGMQAVRANFRYQGSASPCSAGSYDDHDDLVFTVEPGGGACTIDADCDNGLYCDGAEVCNAGVCEAGTAPVCDDGLFCNGDEVCNESTDSCDPGTAPACDDGLFCNGTETCNEGTDSCDAGTSVVCDDGTFCNGAEFCDEGADSCADGTPPTTDDGVSCTDDSCNEATDTIDNVPNDANCDNGLFCDGSETCDAVLDCQAGSNPCEVGEICDESADICEPSGEATDVHVQNIATGTASAPKGRSFGTATVAVLDDNGQPVEGYTVTGNFSGTFNEPGTAVTDASGVASFVTTGTAKRDIVVNFCVDDVAGALPYDPADNANPGFACPEPGDFVHVDSVGTGTQNAGGGQKAGRAGVQLVDENGNAAGAGHTVTGNFSGDILETGASGVTDASGRAAIVSSVTAKGNVSVSFCVSGVTDANGQTYDPAANAPGTTCP
jgi:hypothetical protein